MKKKTEGQKVHLHVGVMNKHPKATRCNSKTTETLAERQKSPETLAQKQKSYICQTSIQKSIGRFKILLGKFPMFWNLRTLKRKWGAGGSLKC